VPRQVHLFDRPTRFVAGTVGQPGDRTFYLQASDGSSRTVSVALEKSQVQVLADRMAELLDEVSGRADAVRVRITAEAARAFVVRAQRVVAAGRPPCPLCSLPLDPEGHICPRQNGHRR
jgi:hypothetical protein